MKDSQFANQLHLLHQVTCRLHNSLDKYELHQTIVQEFCCALEGDCAELILHDFKAQTVVVAAAFCRVQAQQDQLEAPVGITLHLGAELEQQQLHHRHSPWVVQDVAIAHLSEVERILLQTAGMHSLLMIPIVHQNLLLGTICVGQTISCRLWTTDEMNLAELLAEQAAIALIHAQRYSEVQRQAQREQVLNHIAHRIRKSLDLDITINTALTELLALIKATLIYFAVPTSDNSTTLRVTHHVEINNGLSPHPSCQLKSFNKLDLAYQDAVIAVETDIDLSAYGDVFLQQLLNQDIVVVTNTKSDEVDLKSQEAFQQRQIGAWLSIPVWYQECLGYLIALRPQPYNWAIDEQTALEEVANQLAIAISHRRFYAQTQKQAQQAQTQAEQLAHTLQQLHETQSQLIQNEKLSSLGQMVAGIAHEVNNPINFIYANIPFVRQYIEQLLKLINLYQENCLDIPDNIAEFASAIELNFIQSDLPNTLTSIQTGADRVRQLVLTLRNFSRLDEAEKKTVNVHEGLESTLLLLQHRLSRIWVVRQYGNLPPIDSYPGQLNQVFLNLLSNAIDAIHSGASGLPGSKLGQITISTCVIPGRAGESDSRVQVCIQDTGPGISAEYQSKVFDPFFTTKAVGSGTGLGLSISYRIIVHKHQGKLRFETVPQKGTKFIIELPVSQSR